MNARKPRVRKTPSRREDHAVRNARGDFSDFDSQRVLDAAARAVARELGRQAARELWEMAARR